MTEEQWLGCRRPQNLLEYLPPDKLSCRKLQRLSCAGVRRVWHLLTDKRGRRAIETTDLYADGLATVQALTTAGGRAAWAVQYAAGEAQAALRAASLAADARSTRFAAGLLGWVRDALSCARCAEDDAEGTSETQAILLRCIFGNPFRPVRLERSWLTPTGQALALVAYEERHLPSGELDPAGLAVLADALQSSRTRRSSSH